MKQQFTWLMAVALTAGIAFPAMAVPEQTSVGPSGNNVLKYGVLGKENGEVTLAFTNRLLPLVTQQANTTEKAVEEDFEATEEEAIEEDAEAAEEEAVEEDAEAAEEEAIEEDAEAAEEEAIEEDAEAAEEEAVEEDAEAAEEEAIEEDAETTEE